jgi:hypothetical protein
MKKIFSSLVLCGALMGCGETTKETKVTIKGPEDPAIKRGAPGEVGAQQNKLAKPE